MDRLHLIRKVEELDHISKQLLDSLKGYSSDDLRRKLAPDIWSPIEILDHVMLAEHSSLHYCKKKLSYNPDLKKNGMKTWFSDRLVSLYLKSPLKFKAPKVVDIDQLSDEKDVLQIESQWAGQRKELLAFIKEVPDRYIDREVYKHPAGIRLSLGGMLNFFKAHLIRHQKQIYQRLSESM